MISFSTAGLATAKVWRKRGYDFEQTLVDGRNLVFVAGNHGHINMLEYLKDEIQMDLCSFAPIGESSIEFVFRRAHFDAYYYLMDYFLKNKKFEQHNDLPKKLISNLIEGCRYFCLPSSEICISICER